MTTFLGGEEWGLDQANQANQYYSILKRYLGGYPDLRSAYYLYSYRRRSDPFILGRSRVERVPLYHRSVDNIITT